MMLNIKFADGNELVSYDDDMFYSSGCPTCDYGAEYIQDIYIKTTNNYIHININSEYNYAFSTADAVKMFAIDMKSLTESEFIDYLVKSLKEFNPDYIKINDEDVI